MPKIYHITWVTHSSRASERMRAYKVPYKEGIWLNSELELEVTKIISKIIKENEFKIIAYNICGDHIHIILVCEDSDLSNIVRKLKGMSSQKFKEYLNVSKTEKFSLWGQKFGKTQILNESQLINSINYVQNNRLKHDLPPNNGLKSIIDDMIQSLDNYF